MLMKKNYKSLKGFLLLLPLFFCFQSLSQNCKYEKNEIDKFTKKKVIITKSEKVFSTFNTSGFYTVKQEDNDFYIQFDYLVSTPFSGASTMPANIAIKENDQLMFLLDNDEVVTLKCSKTVQSQAQPNLAFHVVNWNLSNVNYPVTREQLKALQSSKTNTLRIYRTVGFDAQKIGQQEFFDVEIKRSNKEDLQRLIKCVIQD
jgi:hypothetical protein